jgi:hypothetical protein
MIWPYDGWSELVIAAATGDVFKVMWLERRT